MDYTNQTYEEISKAVDKLLEITSDNLDEEALRGQKIFTELNTIYIQKSRKLYDLVGTQQKVEHARYRYYAGKASKEQYKKEPLHEAVLKTDIKYYMNIDPVVVEIRSLVAEEERIVKYLEDAKGSLRSRGYDVKAAIEWRKLMMGA